MSVLFICHIILRYAFSLYIISHFLIAEKREAAGESGEKHPHHPHLIIRYFEAGPAVGVMSPCAAKHMPIYTPPQLV